MINVRRRLAAAGAAVFGVSLVLTAAQAGAAVQPAVAKGGQAGFYVDPDTHVNSVRASFVAPTVTCATGSGTQQLRFGVVAPQTNATVTEFAQLDATCTNGTLSYGAVLGANGSTGGGAVSPGDSVTTLVVITPSQTVATLVDHTTSHTYRITGPGMTIGHTAFLGNRPVTGETAIPTFSSPVTMSDTSVNGTHIYLYTHLREYQVNGTDVLISVSTISNQAFKLFFVQNT